MPAQQQQPVQHYAPPQGQHAQVQYQGVNAATQHQPQHQQVQRVNESAGWDQYDDGSEESLDLYSHHQRSRQQQQGHKPNPSMSADSAIHNGSYAGPPVYGTEPAVSSTAHSSLTDDFRRMGISSGQTMSRQQGPPAARKNVSSEALRKREQQLEDEYDDDDGIAGVDIDVTLFPTNSRQMAHIGRSEKYGSPADSAPHTTSSSPAGAPPSAAVPKCTPAKPSHGLSLLQSHPHFAEKKQISPRVSPRHVRSFASVADAGQQSPIMAGRGLAKSASLSKSRSFVTTSVHSDWHESDHSPHLKSNNSIVSRQRYKRPPTPAKLPSSAEPKALRLLRRRSSRSRHPNGRARSASTSSTQLQPLPPHWSKCTKRTAPGPACRSNSTNHTTPYTGHSPNIMPSTTSTVVRNPALAIAGGGASPRANMSRNGSPMGPQHPPQDMAGGQRFYGSAGRSGPPSGMHSSAATTNNSSPVYAGRPYANDNGFDSSSDRIASGGGRPALQQYPPQPQHQQDPYQQQQMQHQQVYGAPAQFYSDPHS
ncbi:hypothetical protein GGI19_006593, partial [Coemansia pectinata]